MRKSSSLAISLAVVVSLADIWGVSATLRGMEIESLDLVDMDEDNVRRLGDDTCEDVFDQEGYEREKFFAKDVYYTLDIDFPTSSSCSSGYLKELSNNAMNILSYIPYQARHYVYKEVGDKDFVALGGEGSNEICGSVESSQIIAKVGGGLRLCYIESEDVPNPAKAGAVGAQEEKELESVIENIKQLQVKHDRENFELQLNSQLLEKTLHLEQTKLEAKLENERLDRQLKKRVVLLSHAKAKADLVDAGKDMKEVDKLEAQQLKEIEELQQDMDKMKADKEKRQKELTDRQTAVKDRMVLKRNEIHQIQQEAREGLEQRKEELEKKLSGLDKDAVVEPEFVTKDADFVLERTRRWLENKLRRKLVNRRRYEYSCWDDGARTITVTLNKVIAKEDSVPNCP